MQRTSATRTAIRAACAAAVLCAAMTGAQAQVNSTAHYLGAAVADTDFGTGLRVFGGGSLTNIFGWEGQFAHYGTESYQAGAFTYDRSAWTLGANALASFPVATNLSVFAKAGVHYVRGTNEGPFGSSKESDVELGVGVGLKWQFSPAAALRADFENIGGSKGDMISVGLQFPL